MVVDALVTADSVLKLSQKVDDPDAFLHLTDSILETIENSNDPVCPTHFVIFYLFIYSLFFSFPALYA